MSDFNNARLRGAAAALALLALATAGCQQGNVKVETNSNAGNANAAAVNSNTSPAAEAATIAASEPNEYRATLVFSGTAEGQSQGIKIPVDVARSGDNRRYAFNLPAIGQIVLLDRSDKRYLIIPQRKQYAELTPELLGFDFRSLTPAQVVAHLRRQQGVERVGEEQSNGRTVTRYRYAATAQTQTQAGQVRADSYFLVDKETGLPVHAELSGQSTGNVQGVSRARLVADMTDIQTTTNAADFELPQGYQQLTEQQIKEQAKGLAQLLQFVLGQLQSQGTLGGAPPTVVSPSPATGSSPAAGASPASPASPTNR